ncbi:MAG: hypothetical protein K8T90_00875 [Planctomycetes bacterium]|nr:hypothetical protein [Planctomycetota bacterium]
MSEPDGRGRSVLRIPRVEFDLAALVLGAVSVAAYAAVWPVLASLLSVDTTGAKVVTAVGARDASAATVLRSSFFTEIQRAFGVPGFDRVAGLLGHPGPIVKASEKTANAFDAFRADVAGWKLAVVAAALLLLWSVVGGALARVYALRKARDQSTPFDEALGFSMSNLRSFIQAPVFILAAGAMFAVLVAACGSLTAIPWAGPVLQVVAQPLSLVLALVTAVIAIGLVFGYPILTAGLAVERNGSLDAVSRTFSYVWTRPVTFGLSSLLVLAVAGVIDVVGGWVLAIAHGVFLLGVSWVDAARVPKLADAFGAAWTLASPSTTGLEGTQSATVWIGWAVTAVAGLLVRGFAVSYVVGGMVDVYYILREEVDLVPTSVVYVESDGASLGEPVSLKTPGTDRAP